MMRCRSSRRWGGRARWRRGGRRLRWFRWWERRRAYGPHHLALHMGLLVDVHAAALVYNVPDDHPVDLQIPARRLRILIHEPLQDCLSRPLREEVPRNHADDLAHATVSDE